MVNTGSCLAVRLCPNPTDSSIGGNQKSHWAIPPPATYSVREAGSGGKYTGRSSATRPERTRIERVQPIRSAITVAGMRNRCGGLRGRIAEVVADRSPDRWRITTRRSERLPGRIGNSH